MNSTKNFIAKLILSSILATGSVSAKAGCVTMDPQPVGAWLVVNNCPYAVIGKFWYDGDKIMTASSPGGFGPIAPGATEGVTPPSFRGTADWHIRSCDYQAWNQGTCKF